jgi:hypothetical protein
MQMSFVKSSRAKVLLLADLLLLPVLWFFGAYPRGMFFATADVVRGHYAIRCHGKPVPWFPEYADLLREKYGVHVFHGGCMVPFAEGLYEDGYNAVAERAIAARFGSGIWKEWSDLAEEQHQAKYGRRAP